jgi:hypothetical protein
MRFWAEGASDWAPLSTEEAEAETWMNSLEEEAAASLSPAEEGVGMMIRADGSEPLTPHTGD